MIYCIELERAELQVNTQYNNKRNSYSDHYLYWHHGVYWTLVRDTDEWKNSSEEERDNYWLLPGAGNLKIPIPFEIGVMFKVLPERILETYFGDDSSKDLRDAMRRQIMGTLGFNPIPQAVLPLAEVYMNHSVFLGREIVGLGMKDLTPEAQYTESTSLVAKEAGSFTGNISDET